MSRVPARTVCPSAIVAGHHLRGDRRQRDGRRAETNPAAAPQRQFTPAEQAELAEAKTLNARVVAPYRAGKFGEAIPLAERALATRKQVLQAKLATPSAPFADQRQ